MGGYWRFDLSQGTAIRMPVRWHQHCGYAAECFDMGAVS